MEPGIFASTSGSSSLIPSENIPPLVGRLQRQDATDFSLGREFLATSRKTARHAASNQPIAHRDSHDRD